MNENNVNYSDVECDKNWKAYRLSAYDDLPKTANNKCSWGNDGLSCPTETIDDSMPDLSSMREKIVRNGKIIKSRPEHDEVLELAGVLKEKQNYFDKIECEVIQVNRRIFNIQELIKNYKKMYYLD